MAERSPKYGLIRNGRGWVKRVGKVPRWIVSAKRCATGEEADEFFRLNFPLIADDAPVKPADKLTLREAFNLFVTDREGRSLHRQTIRDYDDTNLRVMRAVGADRDLAGLTAEDAAAVETGMSQLGTHRRLKHVVNVRSFIRWCGKKGYRSGWTVEMFVPPRKAERRRERAKRRKRPYGVREIRRLLQHGSDRMRALILLALNCAMGPDELLTLTKADVRRGILEKPRQKTGIDRRVPLWAETALALKPIPTHNLFAKRDGSPASAATLIRKFRALCDRACVEPRGLYTMRRTFRTLADELGDQRAAALVMGRELPDIDTVYVVQIKDERIVKLLDHVKLALRIGPALAARRSGQGQRSLSKRLARRAAARSAERARRGARRASTATSRRPSSKGPSRRR